MKTVKPYLELAGVSIRIDDRLVFRNSNWSFLPNQNWVIAGPNGSGKSLFVRALAGELPVVKSEIQYGFRTPDGGVPEDSIVLVSFEQHKAVAGDAPPAARWFSQEQEGAPLVKQFLSQNSVEEINPFEVRRRSPGSAVQYKRRLKQVVGLLDIGSLVNHTAPSLSNGEMRKVLLARALLKRPRLLILDDVFAGLDARFRTHLKEILEKLMRNKAVRILLIDPRLENLPRGITDVLCIDRCRIIAQGPMRPMLQHPFIRRLRSPIGSSGVRNAARFFPRRKKTRERCPLVQMEDISVTYDGTPILSGINWTIRRGESWALLGPNGSGKSTLLSLISGDNPQGYANAVYVFGQRRGDGKSVWDLKKRIGWISPELHLHFPEDQSCLETVITGFHESTGYFTKPSRQQRKAALRMLRNFGLARFRSYSFGSLSTGWQRMTLLARTMVKSPDLLLLDEPCQGLDLAHRNLFKTVIESLIRHTDTAIVYVTHVADEIPGNIHKILQLRNGRVLRIRSGISKPGQIKDL
jgi:molybdate transport system ATP-binding protein